MSTPILYLSYDGMTDPLGQSQVLPYLQGLVKEGFTVTLISFEKPLAFNKHATGIKELCLQSGINWEPMIYTKRPPVLSTLYDLFRLHRKVKQRIQIQPPAILHCRSYLTTLAVAGLAKKKRIKLLFDIRGFWIDERVEGRIWNINNPIYRFIFKWLKKKEKRLFTESDSIVSLTSAAVPVIQQLQGNQHVPVSVIPCCADVHFFDPSTIQQEQLSRLRVELGIPTDAFILSYLGSFGTWYMTEEMFDFFVALKKVHPKAVFLFITPESEELVQEIAHRKNIAPEGLIVRSATRKEVPAYLALSHVSLFFIRPTFSKTASSPTKLAEVMSMGIPVICNTGVGDTESIVRESNAGYILESLDESAYLTVAQQLVNDQLAPPYAAIRTASISRFSLEKGVSTYARIYRKLTGQE